jgi:hypothetical protein
VYRTRPTALHLRGMNMLYETMRSGGANVIMVPASALDSMNLGTIGGLMGISQAAAGGPQRPEAPEGRDGQDGRGRPAPPAAPPSLPLGPFTLPGTPPDSGTP